jgi:hypothetical protein
VTLLFAHYNSYVCEIELWHLKNLMILQMLGRESYWTTNKTNKESSGGSKKCLVCRLFCKSSKTLHTSFPTSWQLVLQNMCQYFFFLNYQMWPFELVWNLPQKHLLLVRWSLDKVNKLAFCTSPLTTLWNHGLVLTTERSDWKAVIDSWEIYSNYDVKMMIKAL